MKNETQTYTVLIHDAKTKTPIDGNAFTATQTFDDDGVEMYAPGMVFIQQLIETLGHDCLGFDVEWIETDDDSIAYNVTRDGVTVTITTDWKCLDVDSINAELSPIHVYIETGETPETPTTIG